jgi:hypothetical protein
MVVLQLAILGGGFDRPASEPAAKQSGNGTCTCEKRSGDGRSILYCMENTSADECSSYCHSAYSDCDSVHFETGGTTCFAILNGEADWGGQRF